MSSGPECVCVSTIFCINCCVSPCSPLPALAKINKSTNSSFTQQNALSGVTNYTCTDRRTYTQEHTNPQGEFRITYFCFLLVVGTASALTSAYCCMKCAYHWNILLRHHSVPWTSSLMLPYPSQSRCESLEYKGKYAIQNVPSVYIWMKHCDVSSACGSEKHAGVHTAKPDWR